MSLAMSQTTTLLPSSSKPRRNPKAKASSRDQQLLNTILFDAQTTYTGSQFAANITKQLHFLAKSSPSPITRILSLGLGSLSSPEKGQQRRLKQLAVLLSLRNTLESYYKAPIEVYAQDPTFTRTDEGLLSSFGIRIARTSSGSSLGEAAGLVDASTLVYSPFLTLEAYEQLLVGSAQTVRYFLGDDFNALLEKWPKYSAERKQVEKVNKTALGRYRRKGVSGDGFWVEADGAFPMAVYAEQENVKVKAKI